MATATKTQSNFKKVLNFIISNHEINVIRNEREVGHFISENITVFYLKDSLTRILTYDYNLDGTKTRRFGGKYRSIDLKNYHIHSEAHLIILP